MQELVEAFKVLAPYVGVLSVLGAIGSYLIKQWLEGQRQIKEMQAKEALASVDSLRSELKDHKFTVEKLNDNMLQIYLRMGESNVKLERVSTSSDLLVREVADSQKNSLARLRDIENTLTHAELVPLSKNSFMIKEKK